MDKTFDAILLAAGESLRYGSSIPKVFLPFKDSTIVSSCVEIILSHKSCSSLTIVINSKYKSKFDHLKEKKVFLTKGGNTRTSSVKSGIKFISKKKKGNKFILIHDAARPGISHKIIDELIENSNEKCPGVIPGIPSYDSLAYKNNENSNSIERNNAYRIQTPQLFESQVLYKLFKSNLKKFNDEGELLRSNGYNVKIIKGDDRLIKITTPMDYKLLQNFYKTEMITKVGNGFDVHSFSNKSGKLYLCGITIPFKRTLIGHSDSDVALHSLTDAILGAISENDIGYHFPPNEKKWQNKNSVIFLNKALELLAYKGGYITNIDLTFLCEEPNISKYRLKMIKKLSSICKIDKMHISVKATTTEKLGFIGRKEGIAVLSTISVIVPFK